MADIGDRALVLDQQRELQRYSNLELSRQKSNEHENQSEARDRAKSNLYRTSYLLHKKEGEMREHMRHTRYDYLKVRGKTALKYSSGDLMKTNYNAHYQI